MTVIDRFEGDTAVIETDGAVSDIDRAELPEEASEGDVIVLTEEGWRIDADATDKRRADVRRKLERLIRRKND